jgi:hypothetical protein
MYGSIKFVQALALSTIILNCTSVIAQTATLSLRTTKDNNGMISRVVVVNVDTPTVIVNAFYINKKKGDPYCLVLPMRNTEAPEYSFFMNQQLKDLNEADGLTKLEVVESGVPITTGDSVTVEVVGLMETIGQCGETIFFDAVTDQGLFSWDLRGSNGTSEGN